MDSHSSSDLHLKLRNLEIDDYAQLALLMEDVYSDIGGAWSHDSLCTLIKDFPEGQIVIEDSGNIIAAALTVKCSYDRFSRTHTYDDLIGRRDRIRHDKNGDALYGMDLFVSKKYRDLRLGRRLYDARKELCRTLICGQSLPVDALSIITSILTCFPRITLRLFAVARYMIRY